MLKKVLFVMVAVSCFVTGCTDKVAYVGYSDHECKYVEINGEPMTCETFDNEFEVVWVDACLIPTEEDGVEASTSLCNKD